MVKSINVGGVTVGGEAPVSVQSMTNTKTEDIESTAAQINTLAAAGCDIARVAVPTIEAAAAIAEIKKRTSLPIVADVHFDYKIALAAVEAGADKVRINPGNIGGIDRVRSVASACSERAVPIRIGVNGGSLEKELLARYGLTAQAMVESAMGHIHMLNDCGFDDICLSLKSSSVKLTVEAYRLMRRRTDYPLHVGVTEAGTAYMGIIKSAAGIGALLLDGIGDTIRVSLTADPVEEVRAGIALLRSVGLRRDGADLISCPSCGRCRIDLISLAGEVEKRLGNYRGRPITVAVMGCVVNGPGEAAAADYGVAGGNGKGVLFSRGDIIRSVPSDELADALMEEIHRRED